jgi:DNA-binding IscR family transcriptional regulator
MTKPPSNLLTAQVIIGLNTIGHLAKKRMAQDMSPSPGSELAATFGLGISHVQHSLMPLVEHGVLSSAKGKYGGYSLVEGALGRFTLVEVVTILGQNIPPPSGGGRPSDFLADGIYDILDVPLETFMEQYFESV